MIPFDNFLPSLLHMAQHDFDLRQIRDFWGPVLVFHNTKDLYATDLRALHYQYFGDATPTSYYFMNGATESGWQSSMLETAAGFQTTPETSSIW